MIEKNKYYIYFCYEDTVDIYNRKITNITFFVSKYKVDKPLCSKDYNDLEFLLPNKQNFLPYFLVILIIIGLFMMYISTSNNEDIETHIDKKAKIYKRTEDKNITIEINQENSKDNKRIEEINSNIRKTIKTLKSNNIDINIYNDASNDYNEIQKEYEHNNDLINPDTNKSLNKLKKILNKYRKDIFSKKKSKGDNNDSRRE